MLKEFREFALRGNVIDLAVGFIIGAAFSTVVNSLVNNVVMPPIGLLVARVDFSQLVIPLSGEAEIRIGQFLNDVISFIIVALVLFFIIRAANRLKSKSTAPTGEPTTKDCPYCLTTIPIKATRCAACTSEVGGGVPTKA
jgi:large conductance mechanosensitive channel